MLNLTCNFNLITEIFDFFLAAAIFKSLLLKMAATVMTVEFGTIHHYSSLEENSEACLCSSLNRHKNYWTFCKLWHFGLEILCFKQQHEYKLASSLLYACLTKIDDFFTLRWNFWIFLFVFVNKQSIFTW